MRTFWQWEPGYIREHLVGDSEIAVSILRDLSCASFRLIDFHEHKINALFDESYKLEQYQGLSIEQLKSLVDSFLDRLSEVNAFL